MKIRTFEFDPSPLVFAALLALSALPPDARAGGSGLNTVVVVNQASSNSCELGNYYCERRQIPAENVLRVSWTGGKLSWTSSEFQTTLAGPLLAMLAARQLTNQVDYVVLSMDFPIQTIKDGAINGTTSALFYGAKNDSGPDWLGVTNSYAASEASFREARPASAPGYSFLTTMLTAGTLDQAKYLVDQGVGSDGTFPSSPVLLAKSSDPKRNIRYHWFDNAIFNSRLCWNYSIQRTNCDGFWGRTNLLGMQTGLYQFSISPNSFVPGAMADSLTSYGGLIVGPNTHTTLLAFVGAGASGSYGTVTEPSPNPDKFPDPQNYFYQARGFGLAECYYQSLVAPYEGLVVGEPLAAPFRRQASGSWITGSNAVLRGSAGLAFQFRAADSEHSIQQVDLFVDGRYLRTLTNLPPAAGNAISVSLNGYPVSYTVPSNATIGSVAAGLATAINSPQVTNLTRVLATAHGDRVELQVTGTNRAAGPYYFSVPSANTNVALFYRVVFVDPPPTPVLTPVGFDGTGFRIGINTPYGTPFSLLASTNLADWEVLLTNAVGGALDFVDTSARALARRFYRLDAALPERQPRLAAAGFSSNGGFRLRVSATTAPYVLQAATNLSVWTNLATNSTGAPLDFEDAAARNFPRRFYRAQVVPTPRPRPARLTLVSPAGAFPAVFRVDGAVQSFRIEVSSDLVTWSPIRTNLLLAQVQAGVTQSAGSAAGLATFLTARRNLFLDSIAFGARSASVSGILQAGTVLQLTVTKINGSEVTVSATSPSGNTTPLQLAQMLVNAVNAHPALQGEDGIVIEDLTAGWFGSGNFNIRARRAGPEAAAARVQLSGPESLVLSPVGSVALDENLADLRPRNHLYVTAGTGNVFMNYALNTTALEDGFHELAAVAYEGSHVRTQTRVTLPVVITNSSLAATLTRLDLPDNAPVQGAYHIQVSANADNVSLIRLFSTGGQLGARAGQSSVIFAVNGSELGAGLHPFYAIVETSDGKKYRTQKQMVRFSSGL